MSFRSRARRRESFAESMSFVAVRPASLRAMSVSVTGRGCVKKFCHGELVAAKPERSAMNVMPMTPTRSRQASLRDCEVGAVGGLPSIREPLHQKVESQAKKARVWKIHARRRRPLLLPVYSYPAEEMMDWISREGMMRMRSHRRRKTVMRRAEARNDGSMLFDISHSINSASTAASAMVVEKVKAERRLMVCLEMVSREPCLPLSSRLFRPCSPDTNGKSFLWTTVDTNRKENRNGSEENTIEVKLEVPPPGRHSSHFEENIGVAAAREEATDVHPRSFRRHLRATGS